MSPETHYVLIAKEDRRRFSLNTVLLLALLMLVVLGGWTAWRWLDANLLHWGIGEGRTTVVDSAELLDAIYDHIARSKFAYLHAWQAGDVLLWDNRCCAHRRESFDPAERRLLYGTPLVSSDILWRAPAAA